MFVLYNVEQYACIIGKQRALSLGIWPAPTICSLIGYSCVWTMVAASECSVL